MNCLGCWYFEPMGGNLGYCEIQDHVVTVNYGCDDVVTVDYGCDEWEDKEQEEE